MRRFLRKQNTNLMKVLLSGLIIIIIFIFTGVFNDSDKTWIDYIEVKTFIAIVLFFILDTLSYILVTMISKKLEDSSKLTKDYLKLIEKVYPLERVYTYVNPDKTKTIFPSIVFQEYQYKSSFVIENDSINQFQIPDYCRKNYNELLSAHRFSKVHNTTLFRLDNLVIDKQTVRLYTSRTTSYDVLVTNRCMDYNINELSVRELYETGPFLNSLVDSKMANHAGYSLFAITSDDYLLMFYRKKNSETYKGTLGPTMTNTISALTKNNEMSLVMMEDSISSDLKRRLKTKDKIEIKLENHVVGITRNLVEGGGVQFILMVKLDVPLSSLCQVDDSNSLIVKTKISKRKALAVKKEVVMNAHIEIDKLKLINKSYKSSPSSLLSLALIMKYLCQKS